MDGSSAPTEAVDRQVLRTESPMGIARSLLRNLRAWQKRHGTSGLKDRGFVRLTALSLDWTEGDVFRALRLAIVEEDAGRSLSLEDAAAMHDLPEESVRKTMRVF